MGRICQWTAKVFIFVTPQLQKWSNCNFIKIYIINVIDRHYLNNQEGEKDNKMRQHQDENQFEPPGYQIPAVNNDIRFGWNSWTKKLLDTFQYFIANVHPLEVSHKIYNTSKDDQKKM